MGVREIAQTIAAKSPLAIRGSKEVLNFSRDHTVADGLNYVAGWNAAMLLSANLGECIAAHSARSAARISPTEPATSEPEAGRPDQLAPIGPECTAQEKSVQAEALPLDVRSLLDRQAYSAASATRRARTAAASWSSTLTLSSQLMQASVTLWP